MKRRMLLCLLCAALLTGSTGCGLSGSKTFSLNFYYRTDAPVFGAENGVLGTEFHDFGTEVPSFETIFDIYFTTPRTIGLSSPFPKGLHSLGTALDDGLLTIRLSNEFRTLSGYGYTVAVACLAQTVLQIDGVESVCLEFEGTNAQFRQTPILTRADFVSQDFGAFNSETSVRVYFADPNGRYLLAEERKNIFTDAAQIPVYVVQQLLAGPAEPGRLATMPEGTQLLGLEVDDSGVCTVNFSSEFLLNRPATELLERMCILSIVNSLTELEQIKSVRFQVDSQPLSRYLYIDLSQPLVRDELACSVVRPSLDEFDATIYVRNADDVQLAAVPVSVRRTASSTQAENLLQMLLDFRGVNGLSNPIPKGTVILSIEQHDGLCSVDLTGNFLQCAGKETDELRAIRAIAATLCTLDDVNSVRISVEGEYAGLQYCDLSQLLIPTERWAHT